METETKQQALPLDTTKPRTRKSGAQGAPSTPAPTAKPRAAGKAPDKAKVKERAAVAKAAERNVKVARRTLEQFVKSANSRHGALVAALERAVRAETKAKEALAKVQPPAEGFLQ